MSRGLRPASGRADRAVPTRTHLRRGAIAAASASAVLSLCAGPALAASPAGQPDGGFAGSGSTNSASGTRLFASAVQSNGDVVAVGESGVGTATQDVLVERFLPNGAPDSSFGSGGIVNGPAVSGASGSVGRAVAIEPSGQIVVAGDGEAQYDGGNQGLLVERYDTNGRLDASFGSGGVQNLFGGNFASGNAVAVEANGDIVAGGSEDLSAVPYATVVRLTPRGGLDSSFGSGGVAVLGVSGYSVVHSLAVQSNGAIVVAGSASPGLQATESLLARLTSSGTLDTSFAGSGAVLQQFATGGGAYSSLNGVAVDSAGNIYAAGAATGGSETATAFLVRYSSSGGADGGFGAGGVATALAANSWLQTENAPIPGAYGLAIAPNGDLILSGEYDNTTAATYGALWAFTPSGSLDSRFGTSGAAVLAPGSKGNASFTGVAISPTSGDVVGSGYRHLLGGSYSGLAVAYTGFGAPKPAAFGLKVTGFSGRYSAKKISRSGISGAATCTTACTLKLTLSASGGTAAHLKVTTRVRSCRKVHGRTRCSYRMEYKPLTVTKTVTLHGAGTAKLTVKLSAALLKALEKHPGTRWTLTVPSRETAAPHTSRSYRRTVQFVK